MKKILSLILAAMMPFSLVACGGNNAAKDDGAKNNATTNDTAKDNAADAGDEKEEVREVLMGINSAQPPASYVNPDGTIGGQNYEVMKLVDELLPQYEFVYEAVDQDALIMGLDSNKYAAAVGNFWHNEKREAAYLFPQYPIGGGVEGIAVNKKYIDSVDSLEAFATEGLKLTPQEASGAMYDVFTKFNEDNPDIALEFSSGDVVASGEQMKWVIEGRYDGAAMFSSEYEELKETVDPNDELYFVPFYAVKTWVLYTKAEAQLAADVDGAMKQLLDDGTLSEISIEWFGYDVYELFD